MRRRSERGFTLMELLVVLAIIGMLAAVVSPLVFRHVEDAKRTTTAAQLEALNVALETYALDNGIYPTTAQGLEALRVAPVVPPLAPNWRGPYLRGRIPRDGWGRPFRYESPGVTNTDAYDLFSFGKDGREGGNGADEDLLAWELGGT